METENQNHNPKTNLTNSRIFVDNPFLEARETTGKTQIAIASECDVTPTFLMRVEQGMFRSVPTKIVEYYLRELNLPSDWIHQYRRFQLLTRRSAPRPSTKGRTVVIETPFDFKDWRELNWPHLTKNGWCKAFCVHPATVFAMETHTTTNHTNHTTTSPNEVGLPPARLAYEIEVALIDSGIMNTAEMGKLKSVIAETRLERQLDQKAKQVANMMMRNTIVTTRQNT